MQFHGKWCGLYRAKLHSNILLNDSQGDNMLMRIVDELFILLRLWFNQDYPFRYRDSHYKDESAVKLSYLDNLYICKIYLYWNSTLVLWSLLVCYKSSRYLHRGSVRQFTRSLFLVVIMYPFNLWVLPGPVLLTWFSLKSQHQPVMNNTSNKVWIGLTHPFPNSNGWTNEVW